MSKDERLSYAYSAEREIPYVTIPHLLKEASCSVPHQDCVVFWSLEGERTSLTYSDVYKESMLFAKGLLTLGYEESSIVAIETKNTPEWLICTFGTQIAGLIPLHFSFGKPNGEDVVNILNGVGKCVAMFVDKSNIDICQQIVNGLEMGNFNSRTISNSAISTLKSVMIMDPKTDSQSEIKLLQEIGKSVEIKCPDISADDICAIFLTSGSTGYAKAVPFTHRNLLHMGYGWADLYEINPGDKFYTYFPFGWQASYPVTPFTNKVTQVTITDMRALKSIDEINKLMLKGLDYDKCVSAALLAPCICELIRNEDMTCKSFPLKVVCTAGLPVDSICAKIVGKKAKKFAVAYGCTEMGLCCRKSVESSEEFENYLTGRPFEGKEIKVVDDNGNILSYGKSGEIYIRSRDRFQGYMNDKQKGFQCCDPTGWYKTDDVGYFNLDGNLVVTGRKSEMLVVAGDLVSPSYLEGILKEHESVANAYVYPIHDKQTFQQSCVAILLRKGQCSSEETLKEFIKKQRGRYSDSFLATRHVPKTFLFFDSFPATHSGKLDRKKMAEIIKQRLNME